MKAPALSTVIRKHRILALTMSIPVGYPNAELLLKPRLLAGWEYL
jgi:hypothetical protein